jgi:hypothetical protein
VFYDCSRNNAVLSVKIRFILSFKASEYIWDCFAENMRLAPIGIGGLVLPFRDDDDLDGSNCQANLCNIVANPYPFSPTLLFIGCVARSKVKAD